MLLLAGCGIPLLLALHARRHALRTPAKPPRAPLSQLSLAPPPTAQQQQQRLCDAALAALLALPAAAPPLPAPALIDSAEALAAQLAAHLPGAAVLGLDVEWSPRSFRGHTCLLQLALQPSGATLVVDALVPEVRRALSAPRGPLARALGDPLLLKVLHAGHNDARWLLQDLGLRLCGVLDTALLAQELQDSARDSPSLAALLVECGVGGAGGGGGGGSGSGGASAVAAAVASKKAYQTSDWRRRPLPPDHLLYAAKDAHYLPFLARALLARLLARGGALPQPLPCSPARAYFAPLLPPRLLRQCAALESPTGHLEALAAKEVFAPAEALAAALRQLVAWRREEHCSGPLGLAADRPASTANATAYILGAVPLSRAEALFAHTFLAASRARHALALAADVNMLLEVATNAALASACRAAVVAAVGCKSERSGGASAPYQAALDSLPHSPFCERLASALCSACAEAAGREGAYLCASLEEGTRSGGGGEVLREVAEGEGEGGSSGAPEPLPLQTDAPPHSKQPHPLSAAAHRDRIKQQRASRIFMPRATPLYSNCELLTPDGVVLARVDKAKCLWYLEKGVGEVVGEDGAPAPQALLSTLRASSTGQTGGPVLRVRMFNAPKGLGHAGDAFHLQPRANMCVMCGLEWKVGSGAVGSESAGGSAAAQAAAEEGGGEAAAEGGNLVRCYVVPRGLRCHMPLAGKSYSNHDVLLSCSSCHRRADVAAGGLLKRIAAELGVSLSVPSDAAAEATAAGSSPGRPTRAVLQLFHKCAVALGRRLWEGKTEHIPAPRVAQLLGALATPLAVECVERLAETGGGEVGCGAPAARPPAPPLSNRGRWRLKRMEERERAQQALEPAEPGGAAAAAAGTPAALAAAAAEEAAWQELVACLPEELRCALEQCGLALHHVRCLAKTPVLALEALAAAACTEEAAESSAAAAAAPRADPMELIMRCVFEGGAAWARAESAYAAFAALEGPGGVAHAHAALGGASVSGLPPACEVRLEAFVRRWRSHFLAAVQPRCLPPEWGVAYTVFQRDTRTRGHLESALVREFRA